MHGVGRHRQSPESACVEAQQAQVPAFGQVNSCALLGGGWSSFQPAGMSNCDPGIGPCVIEVVSVVNEPA